MNVLGIETSCDDTAAAVVQDGWKVLSSRVSSQDEFHARFGGVVPEIASRKHLELIDLVVKDCLESATLSLDEIDAIAVTAGPGLIGSLLVGLNFAKALAFASEKPFYGVDHLEAHMAAPFLGVAKPAYPLVGLVVSGGHTNLVYMRNGLDYDLLGRTVDDAAGEAFDKVAKVLGLGYPGGRVVDEMARKGNRKAFDLPRPMLHSGNLAFSFSGLKTAVIQQIGKIDTSNHSVVVDLVASFQEAVVDVLIKKLERAAKTMNVSRIALSGGVSANSRLRERAQVLADRSGWEIYFPALAHCTDNAAMVAAAGTAYLAGGKSSTLDLNTYAHSPTVPKGRLTKEEKNRNSALAELKNEA
jgi:tRNA N6-adenosine threonylcarbamoyltransferase